MKAIKASVHKNPNIGLYGYATDEYCLVGSEVTEKLRKEIETTLEVPTHKINICGTSLIGAFLAGNNNCLLVPNNIFEEEKQKLDQLKIEYELIDTHLTCLGNNLLCNDTYCYANPEYPEKTIKEISKALGVPVTKKELAEIPTVGSMGALAGTKGILSQEINLQEYQKAGNDFDAEIETGTINFGGPFIHSGLIVNKNGFVAGDQSTGVELTTVDEAFR